MSIDNKRIVSINKIQFEVTEDEERIYFKEISDRKNKAHFSFTKNDDKNKTAEDGLRIFFTELFG
jgi:hypothetical protein